jgi:hypothetical protein
VVVEGIPSPVVTPSYLGEGVLHDARGRREGHSHWTRQPGIISSHLYADPLHRAADIIGGHWARSLLALAQKMRAIDSNLSQSTLGGVKGNAPYLFGWHEQKFLRHQDSMRN